LSDQIDSKDLAKEKDLKRQEKKDPTSQQSIPSNVMLNDSNEIVDKRQLLSAGLNVKPKRQDSSGSDNNVQATVQSSATSSSRDRENEKLKERRRKQQELVARQYEEYQKRKEQEEKEKEHTMVQKLAKRTDEDAIAKARARFLARKAQGPQDDDDSD
jgi:hypothetical protein